MPLRPLSNLGIRDPSAFHSSSMKTKFTPAAAQRGNTVQRSPQPRGARKRVTALGYQKPQRVVHAAQQLSNVRFRQAALRDYVNQFK
jgi:hypothetical protein